MSKSRINISLLDLNHTTTGLHASTMPLGIGLLASYLLANLPPDSIDVSLYKFTDNLCTDAARKIDVIGFSMYSWNTRLNLYFAQELKLENPAATVVCGGPNINYTDEWVMEFLKTNPFIDYLIPFDAEIPLLDIVKEKLPHDGIWERQITGAYYLSEEGTALIFQESQAKLHSLSEAPSPYLTGLMDKFFPTQDSLYKLAPFIETNRGCPYHCTFCHTSHDKYSNLLYKDLAVIEAEILYFAERLKDYPNVKLYIADNNFGMFNRDNEIADIVKRCQEQYGWPHFIDTTVGKSRVDNILGVMRKMRPGTITVTMSTQSMTPEVLVNIKRKNLSQKDFLYFQDELSKSDGSHQHSSNSEIIIGLPGETRESFFSSVEKLVGLGIDIINPYTLMVLRGTKLGDQIRERQDEYCLRYRIVPKQFGKYNKQLVVDTEEVAVATPTMSFADYLECRALGFILQAVYKNEIFRIPIQMLRLRSLNVFDWLLHIISLIKGDGGKLGNIFNSFIKDAEDELWESEEALHEFFEQESNYKALLDGKYGENLLAKYFYLFQINVFDELMDVVFHATEEALATTRDGNIIDYLREYKEYCNRTKRVSRLFDEHFDFEPFSMALAYDFEAEGEDLLNLRKQEKIVTFGFAESTKVIVRNLKNEVNASYSIQQFLRVNAKSLYPTRISTT